MACRRAGRTLKVVVLTFARQTRPADALLWDLKRHSVFYNANDGRDNRAGNATPYCLTGEGADVDIVAYTGHHGNERSKELATTNTPTIAPAMVLPSVPELTSFDAAPTALPPIAPAII